MKPAPLYFINALVVPAAIIFSGVLSPRQSQIGPLAVIGGVWLLVNLLIVATNIKNNLRPIFLASFCGMLMGLVVLAIAHQIMPRGGIKFPTF